MLITAVKRDKKHCVAVETDAGGSALIDTDVAAEYGLKPGMQLTEAALEEILRRSDFVRARERALWYLDRSDRTERALRERLRQAGFPAEAIDAALGRLKETGLIDDRRFAERYAERCAEANISPRQSYAKLLERGVPKELAREVLDGRETDESAQIRALIDKKYRNKLTDRAAVQKVYAALIRRGFSFSAVREVLKQYSEELQYINGE